MTQHPYLYLTTIGRYSGKPHIIEIWFVEHGGAYYLMSGGYYQADWVKNIQHNADVALSLGSPDASPIPATGRIVDNPQTDTALMDTIKALMHTKYDWNKGLIVELRPV